MREKNIVLYGKKTIIKERIYMVLLSILFVTAVLLALFLVGAAGVIGAASCIVFGDIFVCIFIILLIMKKLRKNRKSGKRARK